MMYLYFGSMVLLAPAIACFAVFYTMPWFARLYLGLLAFGAGKWLSLPIAGELAWMLFWRSWQDARRRRPIVEWAIMGVAMVILYAAWRWGIFLPLVEGVVLVSIFALMQAMRRAAHVQ